MNRLKLRYKRIVIENAKKLRFQIAGKHFLFLFFLTHNFKG
jgi:hypothetical protein